MKVKKTLAVLMSAAILFGTAACSGTGETQTKSANTKTDTASGKPTVIKAVLDAGIIKDSLGQKQFLDEFSKQTGIKLQVTQPNHNEYIQKVKMSFASGDVPDIVEVNNNDMVNFANNGALYDMTDLIAKSSVFQNIMKDKASKEAFDSIKVNNKIYACPQAKGSGVVTYIRKDLLDKAHLKVPTTYDEFITALRAFSKMKTKNGKAIIPYTAPGIDPESSSYLPEFYQQTSGKWEKQDGKWVDGFTTTAMADTLTKLQSAYKEGLLDKEIITNKTSTCRDKWMSGQVGAFSYWAGKWFVSLNDKLKSSTPEAEVVAMPALQGTNYYRNTPNTLAITSKASNPEGIFKYFFEYIHDGKNGTMLWTHGVKDVHYKVDSNGNYQTVPCLDDPSIKFLNAMVELKLNIEPNFKDPFPIDSRVNDSNKALSDAEKTIPLCPPSNSYNKNGGTLQTWRSQIIAKVVVSGLSVNTGISQYKSQADTIVSQISKEFNASK